MIKLIKKTKKGIETNPIIRSFIILLSISILTRGLWSAYTAYVDFLNKKERLEIEQIIDKFILRAVSGEGNMTDARIKRNIYVFKNLAKNIEVYSYREVFKTLSGSNQVLSTPVIEFDRYYTIPLSDNGDTKIVFPEGSGSNLVGVNKIGIQIDSPNNDITIFAIDNNNFIEMTEFDINLPGSKDDKLHIYQGGNARNLPVAFYRGDPSKPYGRILNAGGSEYSKLKILIKYKRDIIGYIDIDKDSHKMRFMRTE